MIQFTIETSQQSHVSVLWSGKTAAYSSGTDVVVVGEEVLSTGHQELGKVTYAPFSFPLGLRAGLKCISWLFTLFPPSSLLLDILICGLFSVRTHSVLLLEAKFSGALWFVLEPKTLLLSRP